MRNPWLKKNPFMSVWLSAANAAAGKARGAATAAANRQAKAVTAQMAQGVVDFWSAALTPPSSSGAKRKKKR